MIYYIILAVTVISLISLAGILTLSIKPKFLHKILLLLVAFAAGTMLAAAFFDLLPEALENYDALTVNKDMDLSRSNIFLATIIGIIGFFIVEKFIHWHHCHHSPLHHVKKKPHSFTYMNLIGDGIHNFLDGAVVAAAFLNSVGVGMIATIAIILHEIPQEIGDFAILLHGGFSKYRALFFNFLSAVTSVLGAILAYFYLNIFETALPFLLAFSAGGFVYIAVADLFPELRKEAGCNKGLHHIIALVLGVIVIWWLIGVLPHGH